MNTKLIALGFLLGMVFSGVIFLIFIEDNETSVLVEAQELANASAAPGRTLPDSEGPNGATDTTVLGKKDTRFKVQTIGEAARKRFEGEYVLDSEIEQLMTKLDRAANEGSVSVANDEWERYAKLLTVLGMSKDDQVQMQLHYQKIVKAKIVAGQMATSLANAQSAYEQGMRRILGDNFDLYSAYESEGIGRYEVRLFSDSLASSSSGLVTEYDADQLYDLFSKHEVYSPKALGFTGLPFQPNPTPRSGVFASQGLKESLSEYTENAKALLQDPNFQSLSPGLRQAITQYLTANGDQLAIDYRASIDPEFALAMWKRNSSKTKGVFLEGKLKSGESFSSKRGLTRQAAENGVKP